MLHSSPINPIKPQKLKRLLRLGAFTVGSSIALACQISFAQYINLTIGGQLAPGFYGELAIGNNPPPPVWNSQPVLVEPSAYNATLAYIYAPAEHINNWRFYCVQYNACQRAVFFVRLEEQNPWWERRMDRVPMPESTFIWDRERRMERLGEFPIERRRDQRPGELPLERRREERHEEKREDRRDERSGDRGAERR